MKRIGIFTSGRDAPGTNATIRSIAKTSFDHSYEVIGFRNGIQGLVEDSSFLMDRSSVSGILPLGGTILGTSSSPPYMGNPTSLEAIKNTLDRLSITALIGIGSFQSMQFCSYLTESEVPVVGIPATIDNNIPGTEYSIGFLTAVNYVSEALDRLHTTATSHHRVFLVEVMGGQCGWIALFGGITGGADLIILPEKSYSLQEMISHIKKRENEGKQFSIVVLADTAGLPTDIDVKDKESIQCHNELLTYLGAEIQKDTGMETRQLILGHLQRGGSPSASDRLLGTILGNEAVKCIRKGITGVMVGYQNSSLQHIPLDTIKEKKPANLNLLNTAKIFY